MHKLPLTSWCSNVGSGQLLFEGHPPDLSLPHSAFFLPHTGHFATLPSSRTCTPVMVSSALQTQSWVTRRGCPGKHMSWPFTRVFPGPLTGTASGLEEAPAKVCPPRERVLLQSRSGGCVGGADTFQQSLSVSHPHSGLQTAGHHHIAHFQNSG